MDHLRGGFVRYLARHAGREFRDLHQAILKSTALPLLGENTSAGALLAAVRRFAETKLYASLIVRSRELTAHAVLSGLLNAYLPVMKCERKRFELARDGQGKDDKGRLITTEQALTSRLPAKYLSVYKSEVAESDKVAGSDPSLSSTMERIHRIHMILDYIAGMTDDYSLKMFRLVSGIDAVGYAT